jgi:NhaA family Na+:H+ antiporter
MHFAAEHFLPLPVGALFALVWANTAPASYFTMAHTLSFAVNNIGMALFFGLVAQEIFEAMMVGGALHTWRRWMMPLAAAAGGAIGSTAVFLGYVYGRHELMLVGGWPIASAVDIAFAYFVVRAIFGRGAAVPFVLLLAVASNAVGFLGTAVQGFAVEARPGATALLVAALGLAAALRRFRVHALWPYVFVCGTLAWFAAYFDGVHPALALVPIVPFMTHTPRDAELFEDHGAHKSPRHFEHAFAYPVQGVLFLFALVNAGVVLSGHGTGTWAILTAALGGRTLGILAGVAVALALGLHLPARLHWRELAVVALAASTGFTFTLFFATGAFGPGPLVGELKLGALLTSLGIAAAFAAARALHVGRFARHHAAPHHHHGAKPRLREATIIALVLLTPALAAAQTPLFGTIDSLSKGMDYVEKLAGPGDRPTRSGWYPEVGQMITGAGWISIGPGYRQMFADGRGRAEASAALSWRAYKAAQTRVEYTTAGAHAVTVGGQAFWRDYTQISYFGIGRDSLETDRSQYRLQSTDVVGYASVKATNWLSVGGRVGWLYQPSINSATGPMLRDLPDIRVAFPQDPGVGLEVQPSYVYSDVWIGSDTRNHRSYATEGGVYRVGRTDYVDQDDGAFTFGRYEVEGLHFVPMFGEHSVLALHAWGVFTDAGDGKSVPFYLLPSLGGNNTLRAYSDYRFHDRHALVLNVESRWLLFEHLDAAAFVDVGNVAPRMEDLDLDNRVYGVGFRVHTDTTTLLRLDMGHGTEGWQIAFKLSDALRLARLGRFVAAVPFVP